MHLTRKVCSQSNLEIRFIEDVQFLAAYEVCEVIIPKIMITEVADPINNVSARFVELFNAGDTEINLSGWKLNKYLNGSTNVSSGAIELNGIIIPIGGYVIIASTDYKTVFNDIPEVESTYINGTGDDVYQLVDNTGATIDIYGVIGVDGTGTEGVSGIAHSAGAKVRHMAIAVDFREANNHIEGTLAGHAATTSTQLRGVISDETGTGALVFANTPTLVTPAIGAATGTTLVLSGALTSTAITLDNTSVGSATATAGTSATTIDTWSATDYTAAKYIVQLKKGNDIEVIEVLVAVNGTNDVYLTEYADVQSNGELGTTNAVYSGGNVLLQVTAAAAATSVKVHKIYIEA